MALQKRTELIARVLSQSMLDPNVLHNLAAVYSFDERRHGVGEFLGFMPDSRTDEEK